MFTWEFSGVFKFAVEKALLKVLKIVVCKVWKYAGKFSCVSGLAISSW